MDWAYTKNLLEDRFRKANRFNDRYLLVEPYDKQSFSDEEAGTVSPIDFAGILRASPDTISDGSLRPLRSRDGRKLSVRLTRRS
jgi:hypothetical protein